MRTLKIALAAAVGSLALAGAAQAADDKPVTVAFNVGANNDYEFRGISQTDNDPSVFGGVDLTIMKMGYAGTWLSNVDFGNGTDFEYDLYAGVKPTAGPVSFDFGVIRYGYSGSPSHSHQDYWEFKAAGSVPAGPVTLGAAVYYSPEFFGKTGDAVYYEFNGSAAIPNTKFSVSGALGYQQVKGPLDYTTWNVGVGYALTDHIGLDVRYWDTDADKATFGKLYKAKAVASIKLTW